MTDITKALGRPLTAAEACLMSYARNATYARTHLYRGAAADPVARPIKKSFHLRSARYFAERARADLREAREL